MLMKSATEVSVKPATLVPARSTVCASTVTPLMLRVSVPARPSIDPLTSPSVVEPLFRIEKLSLPVVP